MARVQVSVSVSDDHVAQIHEVAVELRARGMDVDEVLVGLGIVVGRCDDADALRGAPGVQSVDEQQSVQLPPPDAGIQ